MSVTSKERNYVFVSNININATKKYIWDIQMSQLIYDSLIKIPVLAGHRECMKNTQDLRSSMLAEIWGASSEAIHTRMRAKWASKPSEHRSQERRVQYKTLIKSSELECSVNVVSESEVRAEPCSSYSMCEHASVAEMLCIRCSHVHFNASMSAWESWSMRAKCAIQMKIILQE